MKTNAVKLQAAFARAFPSPMQIVNSVPQKVKDEFADKAASTSQRAAVVDWAQIGLSIDPKAVDKALQNIYADFTVLGHATAGATLGTSTVTNWNTWKPGNEAAAALVRPSGALKKLLKDSDIVAKGILDTKTNRIGSILADGLAAGKSSDAIARDLRAVIENPQHALAIAQTEGARAQVLASKEDFTAAGVELFEWITADPCDDCETNEVESEGGVPWGFVFNTGDTLPPAHPMCRCDIVPVIP